MSAAPYSDEINRGYEILKRHLIDVGLWNRIEKKYEIDPLFSHPLFNDHFGGIEFDVKVKKIDSRWHIVYTKKDLFNMFTETKVSSRSLWDIGYEDLLNILFSVTQELRKEEEKLLKKAIRESEYRKAAKRMHYFLDDD
jgi:hypothetical protein